MQLFTKVYLGRMRINLWRIAELKLEEKDVMVKLVMNLLKL